MKAGALRKRIIVQQATKVKQAGGQNVPTWSTYATCWAEIKAMTGRNLAMAQANTITTTATHTIRIRFLQGLVPGTHRISYGGSVPAPIIGGGDALSTLTLDELAAMDLDPGTTFVEATKHYQINSILNTDERNRELLLICTEVLK